MRHQPMGRARNAAHNEAQWPQQPKPDKFGGDGGSRRVAQACHAIPAVVGDPGCDHAFAQTKGGGGFGTGPAVDDHKLHDPTALGRG